MKVVWEKDSGITVRNVYESLLERRHIAYTTVLTMMKILERKGFLKKKLEDRAFVYRPSQPRQQVIGAMVRDFVNRVFNGSAEPLLLHLVKDEGLDGERARGDSAEFGEDQMTVEWWCANLLAWSAEILVVVAAGAALCFAFRLQSPRPRLLLWQTLLVVSLLLPLAPVRRSQHAEARGQIGITMGAARAIGEAPSARWRPTLPEIALGVLGAGMVLRLIWLSLGLARLRRYRLNAQRMSRLPQPIADFEIRLGMEAEFCLSPDVAGPVTFGFRRGVVLVPESFPQLDEAAQTAIACHELLHLRRGDWLWTLAEELARAILWFHPAIWWLLGQIQLTREQVVDEAVIRQTGDAESYINALVSTARIRLTADLAPAPLFLRKRHLASRVASIVEGVQMSRSRLVGALIGIAALLPLAVVLGIQQFPLRAAPEDAVADSPGVEVPDTSPFKLLQRASVVYPSDALVKNIGGFVVARVTVNENGEVTDALIVSGPQELRAAVLKSVLQWHFDPSSPFPADRGFEVGVRFMPPTPGASGMVPETITQADTSNLPSPLREKVADVLGRYIGRPLPTEDLERLTKQVAEVDTTVHLVWQPTGRNDGTVTVRAEMASGATAEGGQQPPQRLRVGQNVEAANLVRKITPVYPAAAKQQGIQGTVRLEIVIGRDGQVKSTELISGQPLLAAAAIDAVKQWVYRPTLLNGDPVEVATTVNVNFTLALPGSPSENGGPL